MAGTFSQWYEQVVFAVKGRDNLIIKSYKYDFQELLKKFEIEFKEEYVFEFF